MRAAVLEQIGEPLVIHSNIKIPPLRKGQVLVELAYSGVCHSQLCEAKGERGKDPFLPHLLGHEGSGWVRAVAEGVTKVSPGERVVLGWIKGSGLDAGGTDYTSDGQVIHSGGVTTFNEYSVVSENRVTRLPDGIPLDVAVLLGCAVPTGAGIILNTIKPHEGSSIAIFGLGGIGLSALMACNLFELSQIFVIDVSDEKLELARILGATDLIQVKSMDPLSVIREKTAGAGVDFAVEATGQARIIEQAFASVKKSSGLCIFASHPALGENIQLDPYDLICGKRLQGTWGGDCDPDRDLPRFYSLYLEGKLPLEKLLSKRYRLDQVNEALADLKAQRVARPLIEINPNLGR